MRGGILDVFPPTEEHPLRVEFWGDEIEEIRYFKVADQRSLEPVMPRFHAGYSVGTVAGALVGAVMVALHVPVTGHLLAVAVVCAPLVLGVALLSRWLVGSALRPVETLTREAAATGTTGRAGPLPARTTHAQAAHSHAAMNSFHFWTM